MMNIDSRNQLYTPVLLNQLGDSTGDFYLVYDCRAGKVTFSENTRAAFDVFPEKEMVCSLEAWRTVMDRGDAEKMQKLQGELLAAGGQNYNLNYRVTTRFGQHIWVNSRGRTYADASGKVWQVVGRISPQSPVGEINSLADGFHREELLRELGRLQSGGEDGYLILIGIDNLKLINMKHGWEFGDAVIRSVMEALNSTLACDHRIFRLNSDVFAVAFSGISKVDLKQSFEQLNEYLRGQCTVSAGCVSIMDYQVPNTGTLLQYAESSLEAAKVAGKNRMCFFSPEDYEKKLSALELRDELQRAVERDFEGFSLNYQAQVGSETYDLIGAEVLLRFCSPRRGPVPPTEFVPILEESELIYEVGLWVVRKAMAQCKQWRKKLPNFHMSVNMSYGQLSCAGIETDILRVMHESGMPGNALTVEVTESMQLMNYPYLNDIFKNWKREGIKISVDDFGTGYSNLGRLKDMEIDEIKIDRCFISGIQSNVYNYRLVSNLVELAESCHIHICCEGVENMEELAVLEKLRPSVYQGYLFAWPCSAEDFGQNVTDWEKQLEKLNFHLQPEAEADVKDEEFSLTSREEALCAKAILDAEEEVFYLSDVDTYEMYYLNPAGQKMTGVRDYQGKKCYNVLHGQDAPCDFCNNKRIRQNSFYVWEHENKYCGRHFLLKNKLLCYGGRNIRMEAATDVTKQERVSRATQERLDFANRIVGYLQTLSGNKDYAEAVDQVLASVGQFYRADRAYLFERSAQEEDCWANTFEWCAEGIPSRKAKLQAVHSEALMRWLPQFQANKSVIILNPESVKTSSPLEWNMLNDQQVQRLIAVPLMDDGNVFGFVGVDNPRYAIHDDSQVRVLASFLLTRMHGERNEQRYRSLLRECNADVRKALDVGFWSIRIHRKSGTETMVGDNVFYSVLGISRNLDPRAQYLDWYNRIEMEDLDAVAQGMAQMRKQQGLVSFEYRWKHPSGTLLCLRFSGMRFKETEEYQYFKGFCRCVESMRADGI